MFTGLVQSKGRVASAAPAAAGARLVIDASAWGHRPGLGDSISVSGVCLTVAALGPAPGAMAFDVVPETLGKTTLGSLRAGSTVNLEHACRADTLLGGHIVQGHVDGVGAVVDVRADPADWRIVIEPPPGANIGADLMEFCAPKGSIAVEGVSLTIASLDPGARRVEIALIPTTLELTTLGALRAGDRVNLEMDCIAKQVVHWLRNYGGRS